MPRREKVIGHSIAHSLLHRDDQPPSFAAVPAYFYAHWLTFACVSEDTFRSLRKSWQINEEDYRASFTSDSETGDALQPMGDMGYSGSTFYTTSDAAYLVKSVPRHFEHSFFKHDLLEPYAEHMRQNPASLLVRITDFLENTQSSIGTVLGLAPSHHIVMENIKYGQDQHARDERDDDMKWHTWDLKPMSYFYPERDVANGALASEATLSKLADEFDDRLDLTLDQAEEFKAQLQKDTALLARCNAVDYSLFLVRIPAAAAPDSDSQPALSKTNSGHAPIPPSQPPFTPPGSPNWRTGLTSADGRWVYRAAILDFFWAKHKTQAMLMTGLIKSYNVIDNHGPMSVTTDSDEYRSRFLKMCAEMIEVRS